MTRHLASPAIAGQAPAQTVVVAPVSVLLITQIRLYADGIAMALDELAEIGRVTVEPRCDAALARLARERTDVVVLDLAGIDDVEEARALARAAPPARVVALAVREHDQDIVAWAEHGAVGIVTREATFDDLLRAIVAAARDECALSPRVGAALLRRLTVLAAERRRQAPSPDLTLREREIVDLLVEGLSNKEIAARLLLGVSTVKNHVHNVLHKLDARTRSEAVALLLDGEIQTLPETPPGSRSSVRG